VRVSKFSARIQIQFTYINTTHIPKVALSIQIFFHNFFSSSEKKGHIKDRKSILAKFHFTCLKVWRDRRKLKATGISTKAEMSTGESSIRHSDTRLFIRQRHTTISAYFISKNSYCQVLAWCVDVWDVRYDATQRRWTKCVQENATAVIGVGGNIVTKILKMQTERNSQILNLIFKDSLCWFLR
jgi:hypothetical protein